MSSTVSAGISAKGTRGGGAVIKGCCLLVDRLLDDEAAVPSAIEDTSLEVSSMSECKKFSIVVSTLVEDRWGDSTIVGTMRCRGESRMAPCCLLKRGRFSGDPLVLG